MKRQKVFRIAVPRPCNESWADMTQSETGRFCSSCRKTVVDFSALSDKELLHYFSNRKEIPCGRFHKDQLGVNLLDANKKRAAPARAYAVLSALLALYSFKTGYAAPRAFIPVVIAPKDSAGPVLLRQAVVISGSVSAHNRPLAGVEVLMDRKPVALTDSNGRFEFPLTIDHSAQTGLLEFIYPGLLTTVRSYHAAMQSTRYEIVMEEPVVSGSFMTMGVAIIDSFPVTEIQLNKNAVRLTPKLRAILSDLAVRLRASPGTKLTVLGFVSHHNEKTIKKWQLMVRDYLVDQEGFSADRFKLDTIEADTGEEFLIQLKAVTDD